MTRGNEGDGDGQGGLPNRPKFSFEFVRREKGKIKPFGGDGSSLGMRLVVGEGLQFSGEPGV